MKIRSILTACCLILGGALGFAQQPAANANPNDSFFSSDLVMWSYMQEPQPAPSQTRQTPTPDPNPETQPSQNPTPSQPQQNPTASPSQESPSDKSQTATTQTFIGAVSKEADSFILQVS